MSPKYAVFCKDSIIQGQVYTYISQKIFCHLSNRSHKNIVKLELCRVHCIHEWSTLHTNPFLSLPLRAVSDGLLLCRHIYRSPVITVKRAKEGRVEVQ